MIKIQLEQAPAVASDPVHHLVACHRRIEQRLETFERAGSVLESAPSEALTAIENSLRFMDLSGALHTADEEQSLFPRLKRSVTADELAYIEGLEAEHQHAEDVYAQLKQVVDRLRREITADAVASYRDLASTLGPLYRSHIESEDRILTSIASRVLSSAELEEIQSEMRERRL